jgi:hypothetical protein
LKEDARPLSPHRAREKTDERSVRARARRGEKEKREADCGDKERWQQETEKKMPKIQRENRN